MTGGLGADTIGVDASGGDVADAGAIKEGNLLLLSRAGAGTITVDLSLTDGNDTMPPTAGDDQVDIAGIQSGFLHADASGMTTSATLLGSAAANRLTGSQVGDSIAGGAGNDSIDGGPGADTIDGGLGADVFAWDITTPENDNLDAAIGLRHTRSDRGHRRPGFYLAVAPARITGTLGACIAISSTSMQRPRGFRLDVRGNG